MTLFTGIAPATDSPAIAEPSARAYRAGIAIAAAMLPDERAARYLERLAGLTRASSHPEGPSLAERCVRALQRSDMRLQCGLFS